MSSALIRAGDGFGKRAEDAVLHGCLPVQIGDNITDKFETIVDWDSFTTRIPEANIERVPEILLSYTDAQVRSSMRPPLLSLRHAPTCCSVRSQTLQRIGSTVALLRLRSHARLER